MAKSSKGLMVISLPVNPYKYKYRQTGSDQQEDLAALGSVQLRQTLALRLPGERPLLETNGDIL